MQTHKCKRQAYFKYLEDEKDITEEGEGSTDLLIHYKFHHRFHIGMDQLVQQFA